MKRIFFKGHYGYKNVGDDSFVITADWICQNIWNDTIPYFIGIELPVICAKSIKYNTRNTFV
jgi:hypothetical protein